MTDTQPDLDLEALTREFLTRWWPAWRPWTIPHEELAVKPLARWLHSRLAPYLERIAADKESLGKAWAEVEDRGRKMHEQQDRAESAEARCAELEEKLAFKQKCIEGMDALAQKERETMEAKLVEAECEIRGIDAVLARRPALDRPTRRENIEKALAFCAKSDAEVADLRRQLTVVNESKSPCGHWSAHATTNDGGKTIQCLECQAAYLRRKLQEWEAMIREAIAVMRVSNYDGIKLMAQSMERTLNAAQQAEEKP